MAEFERARAELQYILDNQNTVSIPKLSRIMAELNILPTDVDRDETIIRLQEEWRQMARDRQDMIDMRVELDDLDLYVFKAFCTDVMDGDTVRLTVDLGFDYFAKKRIRFKYLDAPELDEPGGEEAAEFVKEKILGKHCYVRTYKTGVYDRWEGEIYFEEDGKRVSLNYLMIRKGLVEPQLY